MYRWDHQVCIYEYLTHGKNNYTLYPYIVGVYSNQEAADKRNIYE